MNPAPEPFEGLQKILALKRYEQPPPGYFNRFADQVIARLEAEEPADRPAWWRRLLGTFEFRPLPVLGYGTAVVGLFALGASASRYLEPDQSAPIAVTSPWATARLLPPGDEPPLPVTSELRPVGVTSSVEPVLITSPSSGLFDVNRLGLGSAQRVSYPVR